MVRRRGLFPAIPVLQTVVILWAVSTWTTAAPGRELVPGNAVWRYLRGTEEASEPLWAWREPGFDDSVWDSGSTPFRYGDGTGGTVLGDMQGAYTSLYLRSAFELSDPAGVDTLLLVLDYDDGCIVWLNGEEVLSRNAPDLPFHDAAATGGHESGSTEEVRIDSARDFVRSGRNVLAVQAFNSSLSDGDFFFEATLTGHGRVADTRFEPDRGLYDVPIAVRIESDTPGAVIRYTTDGSPPTETHGTVYTAPVPITTTTVLRAIALREGLLPTNVDTQTYVFPEHVLEQPHDIPGWPTYDYTSGTGSPSTHDYEMDPEIVDHPEYRDSILDSLRAIPTLSLVMQRSEFWESYRDGEEHPGSVELIYPEAPEDNQQVDCAVIRHSHNRVKNSLKLRFKTEYGPAKFRSDIFKRAILNGDSAVDRFDRIVLRAGNNRSWARNFNDGRVAYTRDQWYRDSQITMTGYGSHGVFMHLYVNGIYWGLYNPVEKPDAWFGAEYFGGEKEDWWASNNEGDPARWNYLRGTLVNRDMRNPGNYEELKQYLDVVMFCDYLILTWMTGMRDWPNNNWKAIQRNVPPEPLLYFGWDCEWSWDTTAGSNPGAWVHPDFSAGDSGGPTLAALWNAAKRNGDFLTLFKDRVYRHCFHDGALTDDNSRARWAELNEGVREAVVAESARWGDATRTAPYTRNIHWQNEVDRLDGLMDGNVSRFLAALRSEGYYGDLDPPRLSLGGIPLEVSRHWVMPGLDLAIERTGNRGSVYFTTDQSDPRLPGGPVSAEALGGGVRAVTFLDRPTVVKARLEDNADWSPLREITFHTIEDLGKLRVTEIMYNPRGSGPIDGDSFEFIELKNTADHELDLSGVHFSDGIAYLFPFGRRLAAGELIVLVADAEHFAMRYPDTGIFDVYEKNLSNAGETITLRDFRGNVITSIAYDDEPPWPEEADDGGFSLVPTSPVPTGDPSLPEGWRRSLREGGSPGEDEGVPAVAAPTILLQPMDTSVPENGPAVFSVWASGYPLPDFQWQKNGVNLPGATRFFHAIPHVSVAASGSRYRCIVSNPEGSLVSEAALLEVVPHPVSGMLVARGAQWRYFKATREPSSPAGAWRLPEFEDSDWPRGTLPIGYGDPPFGTALDDMQNGYSSVALRHRIEIPEGLSITALRLSVDYDDGFVMWIQGVEVLRVNVPEGTVTFDSEASRSHESGTYETFNLPGPFDYLRSGIHQIAVHAFNTDLGSSDFKLDLALEYEGFQAPPARVLFLRGDSDGDGVLSITDAMHILLVLFQGQPGDACPDARDADDSGIVNLTDAIYVLHFLFLGGPAPPEPFPAPGDDPSVDSLGCDRRG